MTQESNALRLADAYEATGLRGHIEAAAELRRQHEEIQATERQVEILSDALAESRKINAELLEVLKTCTGVTHWPVIAHIIAKHSKEQA
jgi:hypothetical protein